MKEKRKNEIKAKLLLWEKGEILSQIIYSIFKRVYNSIKPKVFVLGAVNIDYKMCPKKIPLAGDLEISDTFSIDAGGKANNQACAWQN